MAEVNEGDSELDNPELKNNISFTPTRYCRKYRMMSFSAFVIEKISTLSDWRTCIVVDKASLPGEKIDKLSIILDYSRMIDGSSPA